MAEKLVKQGIGLLNADGSIFPARNRDGGLVDSAIKRTLRDMD